MLHDSPCDATFDDRVTLIAHPTLAHFEGAQRLEARYYGPEFIAPAVEAYAWYQRFPYTTTLASSEGRIVGLLDLFPVTDAVFDALCAGAFNDANLTVDDVADVRGLLNPAAPPSGAPAAAGLARGASPLHMFLSCIVVDEAYRAQGLALRLLRTAVERFACIEHLVDAIVTDNVTPEGERFSRRYGFEFVCASDHASRVYRQDYRLFAQRVRTGDGGTMPLLKEDIRASSEDYWSLPEGQRAELIDGVLYDMTPPGRVHQRLVSGIHGELCNHVKRNGGPCEVYPAPFAVNLMADDTTWVEPDVLVVCDPSKLSERGCEGAPDLVVEVVSPSSRRMDYFVKAGRYEQAGVREYWIVDPDATSTLVYRFEQEKVISASVSFADPLSVGIFDGALALTLSELL